MIKSHCITHFPPASREDMFIPLIIAPLHDFPSMALIFLLRRVREHADVIVHVEVEQGPRFTTGFVDYEVVECIMLNKGNGALSYEKGSSRRVGLT